MRVVRVLLAEHGNFSDHDSRGPDTVKKWTPLFQMLGNFAVSLTCGILVSLLLRRVPKFHSMWIPDIQLMASLLVFFVVSRSIEKYHKKKNAQRQVQ